MKKLNITGKIFGNLTVINEDEPYIKPNGSKITRWICKCICGNVTSVRTEYLLSGHTSSCGCLRNNSFVLRDDNKFIGKTFSYLTVIKRVTGNDKWLCHCKCGNDLIVYGNNLINGNTKSCGCYHKEITSIKNSIDLTGVRFGKLVAIEKSKKTRFGHTTWLCKCDCGGTITTTTINLRKGIVNSCGCIKSRGEQKINKILTDNKVKFKPQYSISDFKFNNSKRCGIFDFAIFDDNFKLKYLIEYDGSFHFGFTNQGWNTKEHFENIKSKDEQKNKYCIKHNIPLIRIPYYYYDNITMDDLCLDTTKFLITEE